MSSMQAGDTVTLQVTIPSLAADVADLTSATTLEIVMTLGTTRKAFTATLTTSGTDAVLTYTCATTDITLTGNWTVQAHVVTPTTEFHSQTAYVQVRPNL